MLDRLFALEVSDCISAHRLVMGRAMRLHGVRDATVTMVERRVG
jgi:hypothetical protein